MLTHGRVVPEAPAGVRGAEHHRWARFDDLVAGSSVVCGPPERVITAEGPDQVSGALEQVQRLTDDGRWAYGYVAYEAAAGLDPGLDVHRTAAPDFPLVWFGICDRPSSVPGLRPAAADQAADPPVRWRPGWTEPDHRARVQAIRARIAAGDTYQCNLTERMAGELTGDPFDAYCDLALAQRGAYCAYLDLGRYVIASASPELFLERRGDTVLMRPMKGTARRGRFVTEDALFAERLASSEKERAENLMIVDLVRNDLSRVADTGSVAVPGLFRVERYPTVLQLTSDVTARLRTGIGLVDLFSALFPCGSVTGAPKASSMRIIRSLEQEPRGVYCGAIGLVAPPEEPVRARFSVAIRTALLDRTTNTASYGTGGGITWDSVPEAEHAELQAKAAILNSRPRAYELLETMGSDGPRVRNLELHLQRMADSARHLGFAFDAVAAAHSIRARMATSAGPRRVRLLLDRAGLLRIDVGPVPPDPELVRVALDTDPVDCGEWWLYHKTTLREGYESRRARQSQVDDVIMINTAGELTELTRATLAVRIDGQWWTPPVTAGCLPGVERARLITAGTLRERTLPIDALASADALAAISSLRGWRPARLA